LKEQKSRSSELDAKFAAAKEAQKSRAELLEKKFEAAKQNKDLKDPPPSINWD
jgi:predicted ATPase with chaperone activity